MRIGAFALVLGSIVWTAALFAAPVAAGSSHPALSKGAFLVYSAGAVVCHQRPERSFVAAGRQLPVCARCTGLYVSALIGGLLALVWGGRALDGSRARWTIAAAALPTAVTWAGEVAGLMQSSNTIRAIAALPLGAAAAWLVVSTIGSRRARGGGAHAV